MIHAHEPEHVLRDMHRRHVITAYLSIVLSAVAHVGLLIYLILMPMNIAGPRSSWNRNVELHEPITVQSVDRDAFIDAVQSFASAPEGMFYSPENFESPAALPLSQGGDSPSAPPAFKVPDEAFEGSLSEPSIALAEGQWQPRQEILSVGSTMVIEPLPELERRMIPDIVRVPGAADIVLPVEPADMAAQVGQVAVAAHLQDIINAQQGGDGAGRRVGQPDSPGPGDMGGRVTGPAAPPPAEIVEISEAATEMPSEVFEETPAEITSIKPIEKMLKAGVDVYFDKRDPTFGYFRLEINRIDKDILPVVPKDILFIQDASASISEQRLYFCREVLSEILDQIGPGDRFNVVRFNDQAEFCFNDWASASEDALVKARDFIAGMQSKGETDIMASLKPLLDVSSVRGRPIVALLVTDGLATTGLTRSTDIIGEFSKLNDGRISIFAMGTMMKANTYLLDLLSYCNRGDSRLAVGGRWGIPEALRSLMGELSQPVLAELSLRFAKGAKCEVYPWSTMNLYSDRPLYIYGRFPRGLESFTFQAKGAAGEAECDMIFTMNLDEGRVVSDRSIRESWAKQKIYTLIGAYARTQDPKYLHALDQTSDAYKIKVPYRRSF